VEQPGELFGSLLMDNPAAGEFIEQYLASVESMIQITRTGNKEAFGELFNSLNDFFGTGGY
jgi:prephenate dehydrogenase